jgi:hypothetical protein
MRIGMLLLGCLFLAGCVEKSEQHIKFEKACADERGKEYINHATGQAECYRMMFLFSEGNEK